MENFRLKVFRAVARHLNFSRAAEELLLTQPAVTQQIQALEEEIGVRLFDRAKGHVRLTAAGERLLEHANQLHRMAELALAEVSSIGSSLQGRLSLAASQTIGQYVLPRLIAAFRRENPGLRLVYFCGNTEEVLAALDSGAVQMALIEGPARQKGLRIEAFMRDRLVLVAAAHPWAGREITVREFMLEPLIMREVGSGSRRVVEQALARLGAQRKQLNIEMILNSTEAQLSAVEAGLGVTFVSSWAARSRIALGAVCEIHVKGLVLTRDFSLAVAAGPEEQGPVMRFRRFLLQRAAGVATIEAR